MIKWFLAMVVIVCITMPLSYGQKESKRLAICNFEIKGEASAEDGERVPDMITSAIKTQEYEIIERTQVKKIWTEKNFAAGKVMNDGEIEDLVNLLKADYVMLGCVEKRDNLYNGNYRVVEVSTNKVENLFRDTITDAKDYNDFVEKLLVSLKKQTELEDAMLKAGKELAEQIGQKLKENMPTSGKWRIGVFPFGDKDGKATFIMGNLPLFMQSEVAGKLRTILSKRAPGKFTVLDLMQLKIAFDTVSRDPLGIGPKTLDKTPLLLQEVNLDAGVVGQYQIANPMTAMTEETKVDAYLVIAEQKTSYKHTVAIKTEAIQDHSGGTLKKESGRFQIQFFWKPDDDMEDEKPEAWKPMTLYRCKNDAQSDFANGYFLVVDEKMIGKRYKIKLTNKGIPALDQNPLDPDRMFAAAVMIDGVNSFYQKQKERDLGPVIVPPERAAKWVMTAPKRKLVPNEKGMVRKLPEKPEEKSNQTIIQGGMLEDVTGVGHSEMEIIGFQKNKEFADAFVFGKPRESVAENLGITNDIGLISVYWYGEKLPEVVRGTVPGKEVQSPIFKLKFEVDSKPVEIMKVFYQRENKLPCPKELLEEVKP